MGFESSRVPSQSFSAVTNLRIREIITGAARVSHGAVKRKAAGFATPKYLLNQPEYRFPFAPPQWSIFYAALDTSGRSYL
jgi:hypothetical protein